jgi:large subunit ribosomal protein L13
MSFVTDKCYQAKPADVNRTWFAVSAEDQVLGRLAVKIATVLMGKHKPQYTPHVDTGDFVVVTDVEKIKLTGRKIDTMFHDYYTYYNSGRKVVPYRELMQKHPDRILRLAVRRMLPKNALARRMITKLKIYRGGEHPHQAQNPTEFPL